MPNNKQVGEPLDTAWADDTASYSVISKDDPNFRQGVTPSKIYRKTKPEAYSWVADGLQKGSSRHELYLKLPHPMVPRHAYTIEWRSATPSAVPFATPASVIFDDTRLRTEALQVNQIGYHLKQLQKVARLSMWLGTGGGTDFKSLNTFRVVDDATNAVAFEGSITLRRQGNVGKQMPPEKTDEPTDDVPEDVYQLDFSPLKKSGVYRIVVPALDVRFHFGSMKTSGRMQH